MKYATNAVARRKPEKIQACRDWNREICNIGSPGGGGWGVLPSSRLMGMYRWMGAHFHDWIDDNGVTFL